MFLHYDIMPSLSTDFEPTKLEACTLSPRSTVNGKAIKIFTLKIGAMPRFKEKKNLYSISGIIIIN